MHHSKTLTSFFLILLFFSIKSFSQPGTLTCPGTVISAGLITGTGMLLSCPPTVSGGVETDETYSYTATISGTATVSSCIMGGLDTYLRVRDTCGGNVLGENDDWCGNPAYSSQVTFPITLGNVYVIEWINVWICQTPFDWTLVEEEICSFNAALNTGGWMNSCEQYVPLQCNPSGMGYQWYSNGLPINGATNQVYNVGVNGYYYCVATDQGSGCSDYSNGINIVFSSPPYLNNISGDDFLDVGDVSNYTISNLAGPLIQWSVFGGTILSGQSTNEILVQWDEGGMGVVYVVSANPQCSVDTFFSVTVCGLEPYIIAADTVIICSGDILPLLVNPAQGMIYQWYDGVNPVPNATSGFLAVSQTGNYYCEVIDSNTGCVSISNYVFVDLMQQIVADPIIGADSVNQLQIVDYSVAVNQGVNYYWEITGGDILNGQGTNSVQIQWSGVGTGEIILTEFISECEDTSMLNVFIGAPNYINEIFSSFNIYPNPADNLCVVSCELCERETQLKVFDLMGKEIYSTPFVDRSSLVTADWTSGIYYLQVKTAFGFAMKKFAVIH